RIDPSRREIGVEQRLQQTPLVTAACLEAHGLQSCKPPQPADQLAAACPVVGDPPGLAGRPDRYVQPVLRHIHTDKHLILRHLRPCLAVRGRALATVRVWKTVRSAKLPHDFVQGGCGLPDAAGGLGQEAARTSTIAQSKDTRWPANAGRRWGLSGPSASNETQSG